MRDGLTWMAGSADALRRLVLAFILGGGLYTVPPSWAAPDLPHPAGRVILEVSGSIEHANRGGVAVFDRKMLALLPQREVVTETPWLDGMSTFRGPALLDVLNYLGAAGETLHATALNDYAIDLPVSDAKEHGVILAIELDGAPLTVRDKGPVWVIYPYSDDERLQHSRYYNRSIWQLHKLHVK